MCFFMRLGSAAVQSVVYDRQSDLENLVANILANPLRVNCELPVALSNRSTPVAPNASQTRASATNVSTSVTERRNSEQLFSARFPYHIRTIEAWLQTGTRCRHCVRMSNVHWDKLETGRSGTLQLWQRIDDLIQSSFCDEREFELDSGHSNSLLDELIAILMWNCRWAYGYPPSGFHIVKSIFKAHDQSLISLFADKYGSADLAYCPTSDNMDYNRFLCHSYVS